MNLHLSSRISFLGGLRALGQFTSICGFATDLGELEARLWLCLADSNLANVKVGVSTVLAAESFARSGALR